MLMEYIIVMQINKSSLVYKLAKKIKVFITCIFYIDATI